MTTVAEFNTQDIARANAEWDKLSDEAQETLQKLTSRLSHPVYGLSVKKLAKTMIVVTRPGCEYGTLLTVTAQGSNLDMSIHIKGETKIRGDLTGVKLNRDNVMFGFDRVRATLGLLDDGKESAEDSSVRYNKEVRDRFRSEFNFIKKYG